MLKGGIYNRTGNMVDMSHPKPLVSIVSVIKDIVKSGRVNKFHRMMKSILEQDIGREHIEHIIIDGGSQDGTIDILKEYDLNDQIENWISEDDNGIYDAMNKGIELANGKYINFLNSDDAFFDNAVSSSLNMISKTGSVCSFGNIFTENDIIWKGGIENIFFRMPFCHQTMFVDTKTIKQLNGFETNYRISADFNLIWRMYKNNLSFVYNDNAIVKISLEGISSDQKMRIKEKFKVLNDHFYSQFGFNDTDLYIYDKAPFDICDVPRRYLNLLDKISQNKDKLLVKEFILNFVKIIHDRYDKSIGIYDPYRIGLDDAIRSIKNFLLGNISNKYKIFIDNLSQQIAPNDDVNEHHLKSSVNLNSRLYSKVDTNDKKDSYKIQKNKIDIDSYQSKKSYRQILEFSNHKEVGYHTLPTINKRNYIKQVWHRIIVYFPNILPAYRIIGKSRLFFKKYYCSVYPDVAESRINPLLHYVLYGGIEGRNPNFLFNGGWYLETYRDVKNANLNPLLHYIVHGAKENRDPSPIFSTRGYLKANPDVEELDITPLEHFLYYGAIEGRNIE